MGSKFRCRSLSTIFNLKQPLKLYRKVITDTCNTTRILITMRQPGRHGVSNHRQLDCVFNSLFNLTTKEASTVRISGLMGEIHPRPVHSLPKVQQWGKRVYVMTTLCHMTSPQYMCFIHDHHYQVFPLLMCQFFFTYIDMASMQQTIISLAVT